MVLSAVSIPLDCQLAAEAFFIFFIYFPFFPLPQLERTNIGKKRLLLIMRGEMHMQRDSGGLSGDYL